MQGTVYQYLTVGQIPKAVHIYVHTNLVNNLTQQFTFVKKTIVNGWLGHVYRTIIWILKMIKLFDKYL